MNQHQKDGWGHVKLSEIEYLLQNHKKINTSIIKFLKGVTGSFRKLWKLNI